MRRRKWKEEASGEKEEKDSIIKIQNVFSRYNFHTYFMSGVYCTVFSILEKTC